MQGTMLLRDRLIPVSVDAQCHAQDTRCIEEGKKEDALDSSDSGKLGAHNVTATTRSVLKALSRRSASELHPHYQ